MKIDKPLSLNFSFCVLFFYFKMKQFIFVRICFWFLYILILVLLWNYKFHMKETNACYATLPLYFSSTQNKYVWKLICFYFYLAYHYCFSYETFKNWTDKNITNSSTISTRRWMFISNICSAIMNLTVDLFCYISCSNYWNRISFLVLKNYLALHGIESFQNFHQKYSVQ